MTADLHAYCRLVVRSRIGRRSRSQDGVLLPVSSGVTRVDMLRRLRVHHGITWTMKRLTDVLEELVRLGGAKSAGVGYRVADWALIERLANQVESASESDIEGEEVPA